MGSPAVRWAETWRSLGLTMPSERDWLALVGRYAEPQRHYHTMRHLEECFARLDRVASRTAQLGEVAFALWYHDAVYDPHASDNEACSAELAAAALRRAGADGARIERVRALIMATRHAALPAAGDEALLVDIDLGVLAAPSARFDEYEQQVRAEFAWVPGFLFRRKRREVLASFLSRERIYMSGGFDEDEAPARANLARSIAQLGG